MPSTRIILLASVAVAALAACAQHVPQAAAPAAHWLVGSFEFEFSEAGARSKFRLRCESESQCVLLTEYVPVKGRPNNSELKYAGVIPRQDISGAQRALTIARQNMPVLRAKAAADPDAAFLEPLLPLLNSDAQFKECFDLNSKEPGLLLACAPTKSVWSVPTVVLLTARFSRCSTLFCQYSILPMRRATNAGG
jgi:hypothetical protein